MIYKFWWVLSIQGFCLALELLGGYFFGSLALYSDALHIFSDIFAVSISFAALLISQKKLPTDRMTYGYHRLEVFSAIFNGVMLVILAIVIFLAALRRYQSPQAVMALPALTVGAIGFVGNLIAAIIFSNREARRRDLNVRAVYWHFIGDMLSSVAVVAGMAGILLTGNFAIDALVSMGIAVLLIFNAGKVLMEGTGILLQQSPHDLEVIREKVRAIPHVVDIDDFRLWQVCSHLLIGTAHIITEVENLDATEELSRKIKSLLEEEYRIRHLTLQFETPAMYEQHQHELNHQH